MAKRTSGEKSPQFSFASDEPVPKPAPTQQDHAQRMLDWLQRWPKSTISSKQIYQYAPRAVRSDRETTIKLAEILERHGWLNRLPARHRNWRQWQIIRKDAVLYPKVEG